MPANLTTKIYEYIWDKDSMRKATIYFKQYKKDEPDSFLFDECNFSGVSNSYNTDDWQFLHDLAEEIFRLEKEVNL